MPMRPSFVDNQKNQDGIVILVSLSAIKSLQLFWQQPQPFDYLNHVVFKHEQANVNAGAVSIRMLRTL